MTKKEALFAKDPANKKMTVVRAFDAPLKQVWEAWTKSEILDHWWAPQPYNAETKTMDFREGGRWIYCMVGPGGDRTWCRVDYNTIEPYKSFSLATMFCDEEGNENPDFPVMYWTNGFTQKGSDTTVTIEISFAKTADMEMILKLGFQEGFTAGLGNLDHYLLVH